MHKDQNSNPAPAGQGSDLDGGDENPPHHEAPPITPDAAPPKKWKRKFIREGATPAQALTWRTPKEKAKCLSAWRDAVGTLYFRNTRNIRIAWQLEWLFGIQGYAFASNTYLSGKLDTPVNKIEAALSQMEGDGAIVRASVFVNGRPVRRIWPSSQILKSIPPVTGGENTY